MALPPWQRCVCKLRKSLCAAHMRQCHFCHFCVIDFLKKKKVYYVVLVAAELPGTRARVCVCTCVSDRLSAVASSTLSGVDRYRWISNLFSRPDSCESEKTVRAFLRLQCFPGNSAWCWNKAGICIPTGVRWQRFRIRGTLPENRQQARQQACVAFGD